MDLSNELISQFVKITNDTKKEKIETNVNGTLVIYDGKQYVKLDGSQRLTPVVTTTEVSENERVKVTIKDHQATIIGNLSNPSAGTERVSEVEDSITTLNTIVAEKADIEDLSAEIARIDDLYSENVVIRGRITATEADISSLEADNVVIYNKLTADEAEIERLDVDKLDVDIASATYAEIDDLQATNAYVYNFEATYVTAQAENVRRLTAHDAVINNLDVNYARIDRTNINEAWVKNLMIQGQMVAQDGSFYKLVGLHLDAGDITAGTLTVDHIAVKNNEDGEYYMLSPNGDGTFSQEKLNGTIIEKESLNADRIISNSITVDQITANNLIGTGGWINISDGTFEYSNAETGSFIKWDGLNLVLQADEFHLSSLGNVATQLQNKATSSDLNTVTNVLNQKISSEINEINDSMLKMDGVLSDKIDNIESVTNEVSQNINKYMSFTNDGLTLGSEDSPMAVNISNDRISFKDNGNEVAYINGQMLYISNEQVLNNLRFGDFVFFERQGSGYLLNSSNLLLNPTTKNRLSNSSSYMIGRYDLKTNLEENETYTFTFEVNISGTKKGFRVFSGGGTRDLGPWMVNSNGFISGIYHITFVAKQTHTSDTFLQLYCSNNEGIQGSDPIEGTCVLNWVTLVKGSDSGELYSHNMGLKWVVK